jgi:hypothetical protein
MLDECKGDKFFEVLAFFSNVVLKKTLAAQSGNKRRTGIASILSTATTLPYDKQISLLPLAIAHKVALVNVLKKKEEKRTRFTEFEVTLNAKRDEINQRLKQCKATPRSRTSLVPEKEAAAIKKQLKDNWIGNQKWLDTMLHGDDVQAGNAFLSGHFQDVWYLVEKGQKLENVAAEAGLLENLQSRVQEQQVRLKKWKSFHETMLKEETKLSTSPSNASPPAKELRFDDHLPLQLRSAKDSETQLVNRGPLPPGYQNIVSDMEAELSRIAKAKHNRSDPPKLRRRASSLKAGRSPERKRKPKSESASSKPAISPKLAKPAIPPKPAKLAILSKPAKPAPPTRTQSKDKILVRPMRQDSAITPIGSDATLVGQPSTSLHTVSPTAQSVDSLIQNEPENFKQSTSSLLEGPPSSSPPSIRSPSSSLQPMPYISSEPPILLPPTLTHEEAIAEAIISSIGNATPSPVKKPQPRLSLAERTRMSMAHTTSFLPITESPPSPPSPSLPVFQPPTLQPDRRATLHERTMLSMAAMASNSRQSLAPQESRHGGRKSIARTSSYPVNQFDTPQKRNSINSIKEGVVTPKEELFSDDVDYERIFKSRPKIATSPVFSPVGMRGEEEEGDFDFDEGVTGIDLADVDADSDEENEGFSRDWENSPSKKGRLFA